MTSAGPPVDPLPGVAVGGAGVVQVIDYAPGSTFGPRRLVDHEFVWLLAGSATWTVHRPGDRADLAGRAPLTLRPGTLLLAPSGTTDSFRWDPEHPTRHAWAHLRVDDLGPLPHPSTWPLTRDLTASPVLDGICRYLVDLAAQPEAVAWRRSDQLLALLLDLFVRGPLTAAPAPAVPALVASAVEAARRVWRDEGVRLVEVEELARAVNVSVGHLHRTFRRHHGCGPAHALELVRLSRAALMVQRSNASLTEVAAATGFANAYHLSRRFRAAYGVPPGTYRRSHPDADPLEPVRRAGLTVVATMLARD